jgi:hypothetical protein
MVSGTPVRWQASASATQPSGRNSRRPMHTGTSWRARVSETSAWQFARLPSWPQYCRCPPTDCLPCFTSAVSSITSTASAPPTRRSACRTSSASSGAVGHGEVEMKWCRCGTSPGATRCAATRCAIGSTLLRSPGRNSPVT